MWVNLRVDPAVPVKSAEAAALAKDLTVTSRETVEMWMNPESIIQSEVSQKEKNKYWRYIYIYAYIWNLERWY